MALNLPPIPNFPLTSPAPVTITSLTAELSARLGVPSNPYWQQLELQGYVIEALRTWNAHALYWRNRVVFTTDPATLFYDLSVIPGPQAQLGYNVRDVDLIRAMEFHLLEPADPTAWGGSEMFTLSDFTTALAHRRDQFLVETGAVIKQYSVPAPSPQIGRVPINHSVIDVRRCVVQDANGKYYQMERQDEWELDSFMPRWADTPAVPKAYSVSVTPPFQLQLAPFPANPIVLQMLVVVGGAALNPKTGVVLGIPDDFTWVVKWGALADLLGKDSPARDASRSKYCEQRYQQGIQVARVAATVMSATVNSKPVRVNDIFDLDHYDPNWHNRVGDPHRISMAGLNMMAIPQPPADEFGVALDVVSNAPVASLTADLALMPAVVSAIVDYAEHLAAFKMGGAEFSATMEHYKRMVRLAAVNNERLHAGAPFAKDLMNRETTEEEKQWRRVPVSLT